MCQDEVTEVKVVLVLVQEEVKLLFVLDLRGQGCVWLSLQNTEQQKVYYY